MTLRGHAGSVVGLFARTAVMGWMLVSAFNAPSVLRRVIVTLFLCNAAGYFAGGEVEHALYAWHALTAKLSWGVCYGLGFGAGLGLSFYDCQAHARELLSRRA